MKIIRSLRNLHLLQHRIKSQISTVLARRYFIDRRISTHRRIVVAISTDMIDTTAFGNGAEHIVRDGAKGRSMEKSALSIVIIIRRAADVDGRQERNVRAGGRAIALWSAIN